MIVYLSCFGCEDDDEYSNSSTSPPLPTLRLDCYISRHHPIPILEARSPPSKRSTTATILIAAVSHRIMLGRQGQIPSTSVHVSTATTADFTDDVHRPRLISPIGFPSTGPALSLPLIRHCIHCSSSGRLCTNARPSNCSKFKFFRTQSHMPSMASRLRPLEIRKR